MSKEKHIIQLLSYDAASDKLKKEWHSASAQARTSIIKYIIVRLVQERSEINKFRIYDILERLKFVIQKTLSNYFISLEKENIIKVTEKFTDKHNTNTKYQMNEEQGLAFLKKFEELHPEKCRIIEQFLQALYEEKFANTIEFFIEEDPSSVKTAPEINLSQKLTKTFNSFKPNAENLDSWGNHILWNANALFRHAKKQKTNTQGTEECDIGNEISGNPSQPLP